MAQALDPVEKYYKLNRILLSLIGLWPYQKTRESWVPRLICTICNLSMIIPTIIGLAKGKEDFDSVAETMIIIFSALLCYTKIINLIKNSDEMKDLLEVIQEDWKNTVSSPEIEIMKKSAEQSFELSKIYTITWFTTGFLFGLWPVIGHLVALIVLNTVTNENESSKRLPYIAEYYVDTDEYFYPIIVSIYIATMVLVTIHTANDPMFVVYVNHGCTKFRIFKYRLSQVIQPGTLDFDLHPDEIDDLVFQKIKICVHLHKEAIGYANAIESSYTMCQFFQVGICCMLTSIVALQASTKLSNPAELVKYFTGVMSMMLHLLFYSWMSQKLMDESLSVSDAIYNMEWYRVSIRSRKLLLQMMTRSVEPCKLTAGKLILMSMENFTKIMSQTMSFFTVLCSMRE